MNPETQTAEVAVAAKRGRKRNPAIVKYIRVNSQTMERLPVGAPKVGTSHTVIAIQASETYEVGVTPILSQEVVTVTRKPRTVKVVAPPVVESPVEAQVETVEAGAVLA